MNSPNPTLPNVLSTSAAATYLGLSDWTIREIVRDGKLPVIFDRPGKWRFLRSDLDAYLASHRVTL